MPLYETALGPDEAQYWFWSRSLDWGYYSKPPVIAWLIALPTALFGDHAWSVRLFSPILIGATGLFLFGTARRLSGPTAGYWALVLWHLMPAVMLGATIITTDIPLLACWSAALYALVRLTEVGAPRYRWGAALGAALGLGLLSKYAMIYWPLGLLLALPFTPRLRSAGVGPYALACTIAALVFAPNVAWNLSHGMQTVGHTADNASWSGGLHWDELGDFLAGQIGVFGPLTFLALLALLVRRPRSALSNAGFLLAFIVPPLALICAQALLSRAHANWAMTAYPAATVLLPIWLGRARWVLPSSAALHAVVGLVFTVVLLHLPLADGLGLSNVVKRLRGWDETAAQVARAAAGYDGLLLDDRELAAHLVWELRASNTPIRVLDVGGGLDNTYEYALPYRPAPGDRFLLVTQNDITAAPYQVFGTILPVGEVFVDLNATRRGRRERTLDLWAASDPSAP
nr:glycosyltransferase family 39 protein [Parvularcula dongshanensis]